MKKIAVIFLFLSFCTIMYAQKNEPTEEQLSIIEQYGDDINKFNSLKEKELDVFVKFGDELQSRTAWNILQYRKQRDEITEELLKLKKRKDETPAFTPGSYSSVACLEIQINDAQERLDTLETQHKKTIDNYVKISERRKNKSLSRTAGDPVNTSYGTYEQTETDIEIGKINPFSVTRSYSSEQKICSSFGYGWTTNLDERIILGTEPNAQSDYEATLSLINDFELVLQDFEENVKQTYTITSIETGETELNERFNSLINDYSATAAKARQYSFYDFEKEANNIIDELSATKNEQLQFFNEDEDTYKQLSDYLNELEEEKNRQFIILQKSLTRKHLNQKAMFPGMESFYEETGLDTLTVIDRDGYPHVLTETEEESGIWKNEKELSIKECRLISSGYQITLADGTLKEYNRSGFIVCITDRNGNFVQIERTPDEKIYSIKTSGNEKWKVSYNGNFIKTLKNTRDTTETVSYSYDNNRLEAVKDTDGDTVTMKYDQDGRMTSLEKSDKSSIIIVYDLITADKEKLATETIDEENNSEYFFYEPSQRKTVYKNHDGDETVYYYDEYFRTIKEIQPDGTVIETKYNDLGQITETIENKNHTFYKYDPRGNISSINYNNTSYEIFDYDSFNQLAYYRDRDGIVYEYIHNNKGNLTQYKCGGQTVYKQEFYPQGTIKQKTVYGDNKIITDYEYDDFGNLRSQTTDGVVISYIPDEQNRIKKISLNGRPLSTISYRNKKIIKTDYNGLETTYIINGRKDITEIIKKDTVTGAVQKTRVEYDKRHLPLRIYTGDGKNELLTEAYLYTKEGKIKAEILTGKESLVKLYEYKHGIICQMSQFLISDNPGFGEKGLTEEFLLSLKNSLGDKVFTYKYDYQNKNLNETLLTITDPLGYSTLFEYDSRGNLKKQTDAEGNITQNFWSAAGRLEGTQNAYDGVYKYFYDNSGNTYKSGEENGPAGNYTWYMDGSIKTYTDCYGKTTSYRYDNSGRLKCEQSETTSIWYEYDSLSRMIKQIVGPSPQEASAVYYVTWEYSDDGRSIKVTEGGKYITSYELDAFGNIILQTDGSGNSKSYEYNCKNQCTAISDGYGNKTSYEYNVSGLVKTVILPDDTKTHYEYNALNQVVKVYDECGTIYSAEYDKAGRLKKEKTRADCAKSYEYDKSGRIKKVLSGGKEIQVYNYSRDGQTLSIKDGRDFDYVYKYDSFGRLVNETNRLGYKQYYYYDEEGKLKAQKSFDGSTTEILYSTDRTVRTVKFSDGTSNRFVYDAIGNITQAENEYGKTVYKYDKGGRLIFQKDMITGEELSFEYDSAGNRIKLTGSDCETVYTYGDANELKKIFDNKQKVSIQLEYDINGREILRKFGNGTIEQTRYDKAGRPALKLQKNSRNELIWAEGYIYGTDGKRIATVDNNALVTFYEYNKQGQLSCIYYPYSKQHEQLLKKEAEENGLGVNGELCINRFLSADEKTALSSLLNEMQYTLSYSLSNLQLLIKETYSYDKNGNRTAKQTAFGIIEYNYDKENRLISSGSHGQAFVNYTYDKKGNLISEDSAEKSINYCYNAQNRLICCEITGKEKLTYTQTSYAYDALGRRIIVQDFDNAPLRTIYDSFTFDAIKQGTSFVNGTFTDSYEAGVRWSTTGNPTGERYRYISDDDNYKASSSRYYGNRTQLFVNNKIAAQASADGQTEYFTTDILGSIRSTTDIYGSAKQKLNYDAFGALIQGELSGRADSGFSGKSFDPTSKIYNYGYRDYNPALASFTTSDPIRDGFNWFTYCNGDPVNFVDLWGLCKGSDQPISKDVIFIINRDEFSRLSTTDKTYRSRDSITFKNIKTGDSFTLIGVQTYVSNSDYTVENTLEAYMGGFTIQFLGNNQEVSQSLYNSFSSNFEGPVFNVQYANTKGLGMTNEYGQIIGSNDKSPIRVHSDYNLTKDKKQNMASGGCPMYNSEQAEDFNNFLERNGIKPGDRIKGYIKEYIEP